MDYEVEIVETLSKTIRIKANSESDAYKKIKDEYMQSKIILDSNDYVGTEFIARPIIANVEDNVS